MVTISKLLESIERCYILHALSLRRSKAEHANKEHSVYTKNVFFSRAGQKPLSGACDICKKVCAIATLRGNCYNMLPSGEV